VIELAKYPYTVKVSSLRKFLSEIPTMGIPDKINQNTLPTMGYKSSNDRYLPPILKFINFIDSSGTPTQNYKDFRNKQIARSIMAKTLKSAYNDLFKLYPNAYKKDDTSLRDFFSGTTEAGEDVLKLTVATFKTLCSFADFEAVSTEGEHKGEEGEVKEKTAEQGKILPSIPSGVTINLNIQLALPATDDATVYDKIFKALKENLLTRD